MRFLINFVFPSLIFFNICNGQANQLVVVNIGEGASYLGPEKDSEEVNEATFLKKDVSVSVRPRSGIETVAPGYSFRYGAATSFSCDSANLQIHEGGIMIQSRKIESSLNLISPETSALISGAGCLLGEVETNGGMKLIGVLGALKIYCKNSGEETVLLPGELIFNLPGNRGLGPKVQVNLDKLISTSFLLSGFSNSSSFKSSLTKTANAQKQATGKVFAAEVGDSVQPDSFQVLRGETGESDREADFKQDISFKGNFRDPLSELLGRTPYRSAPVSMNDLKNNVLRPFPSRLLRTK